MDRAHRLSAAGRDACPQQQSVEVDALVAQRVALVHADHGRRELAHVGLGRERRPGEWIALVERVDAVRVLAAVVV